MILDSGATVHIFNSRGRLTDFIRADPTDRIFAGDQKIPVIGYGNAVISVKAPGGQPRKLQLRDVAYCKGFACSVASLRQLQRSGLWWDMSPGNCCLRTQAGTTVCLLMSRCDQYILEDRDLDEPAALAAAGPRSRVPKVSKTTADQWHRRLGHPGPEALNRLVNTSEGARIRGPTTVQCADCAQAKITRQISRVPRRHDEGPGIRIAVDFTHLVQDYEGYDSLMLFTDRWSGYIWDYFLQNRTQKNLKAAFEMFMTTLERQYDIRPRVFESDNEITRIKRAVGEMLEARGIKVEPSAPETQAQNGGAERSGGMIETKARAMRQGANLPEDLWREIYSTAVYLHNRLPKYTFNWKTPYDRFHTFLAHRDGIVLADRKPQQGHLRVYGCKAYAMTATAKQKTQRLHKLDPRAFVGYLVGYQSTNIYRIWSPLVDRIIATRDVLFDEDTVFPGSIEELKDDFLRTSKKEISALLEEIEDPGPQPAVAGETSDDPIAPIFEDDDAYGADGKGPVGGKQESGNLEALVPEGDGEGIEALYPTPRESPLAALFAKTITEAGAPGRLAPAAEDLSVWKRAYEAGRLVAPIGTAYGMTLNRARLHRLLKQSRRRPQQEDRFHRQDLPPAPRHHGDLQRHPLGDRFREAEKEHLQKHKEMNS